MNSTFEMLQKAYQHIKSGEKQEALAILTPLLRVEPNNVEAWYLLGFALTDPEKRIYAFEQVLRLDPANQPAQQQLAKLRHSPVAVAPSGEQVHVTRAQPKPQRRIPALGWILTGAGILLLGLLVAGGGLLLRVAAPLATKLPSPTLTVFATDTPRPTVTPYPRRATGTAVPPTVTLTATPTRTPIVQVKVFTNKDIPINQLTPLAFSEIKSGHLEADAVTFFTLDVDNAAEVAFTIKWTGAAPLLVTLNDPSGLVMDDAYMKANPQSFSKSGSITKMVYRVKKPAIGSWTIHLTAFDAGDYGVVGQFSKDALGITGTIWGNPLSVNREIKITAIFENYDPNTSNTKGSALIELPNGTLEVVPLLYRRGYFEGIYEIPADAVGVVSIQITVDAVRKGVKFTRSALHEFSVLGNSVRLTDEYADRMGAKNSQGYKTLDIDIGLDSTYVGKCFVLAHLAIGDKQLLASAHTEASLVAGHNVIRLRFDMYIIGLSKLNGPYTLSEIMFFPSRNTPYMPFAKNIWQTSPYKWQDFTP